MVIERERLGQALHRHARVVFDRQRASRYLGSEGEATRSAPMLLLPVTVSAGTQMVYEQRNPWQRAWAGYQAGQSRIDYVRPAGAGGDSLLLTYGQTGRRSRTWWRNALDQFGAADVLVAIASLRYTYPGGPIEGTFTARFGPDNAYLDGFDMTAASPAELPTMLERAVVRFDRIFELALAEGKLRPDPTLDIGTPELDPALQRLLDLGRALRAQEQAAAAAASQPTAESGDAITAAPIQTPPPEGSVALYTVQVATPDAASFDGAVSSVRGTPGVRATGIRSTAIGGTSVMTVSYSGSILSPMPCALAALPFARQQRARHQPRRARDEFADRAPADSRRKRRTRLDHPWRRQPRGCRCAARSRKLAVPNRDPAWPAALGKILVRALVCQSAGGRGDRRRRRARRDRDFPPPRAGRRLPAAAGGGRAALGYRLADLRSRMGAALQLEIGAPDDDLARDLMLSHAAQRGLAMGEVPPPISCRGWSAATRPSRKSSPKSTGSALNGGFRQPCLYGVTRWKRCRGRTRPAWLFPDGRMCRCSNGLSLSRQREGAIRPPAAGGRS